MHDGRRGHRAPPRRQRLRAGQGVRLRRRRRHRRGGDLQRRARLQGAGVAQRPPDARADGLRPGRDVPRPLAAGQQDQGDPVRGRHAHGAGPDRRGRLRHRHGRRGLHLPAPGRHHAHPRAGGQHRLRRLPAPGQHPGRRQLPAPPAHQARPPPRVLQRHHRPGRRGRAARGRHRRRGHQADPALRHRRVRRLHALPVGHDRSTTCASASRAGSGASSSTASAPCCPAAWW